MTQKPAGPFASDGEIASKMEERGDALQAQVEKLEHSLRAYRAEMGSPVKDLSLIQVRRNQLFNIFPR
jgi:hypothetical protein